MRQLPQEICSTCNGSGWVPLSPGSLHVKPCTCQGDLRRRQRISAASIPRRYFPHCTLSGFNDRNNPELIAAKARVTEFASCWPGTTDQRGLLIMGGCGVGKTHLAVGVLQDIIDADKPGRLLFSNFQELIQQIQSSFDAESNIRKSEILDPLLNADLLVLDELGSQKSTTFVEDILYYIINTRYNDQRATIFTTSYFDTPAAAGDACLHDRIGHRLRSRLYEMTESVVIRRADDYRKDTKSRKSL
jgi:DNA replication protein DnaC